MANRYFNQFQQTLVKKVCTIYARVAIGASGAATLNAVQSKGVVSITRNSTGDYTIQLGTNGTPVQNDVYYRLLEANVTIANSTGIPDVVMGVKTTASTLGSTAVAASTIEVVFSSALGGSATDPASGDVLYFQFTMQDSNAP